MRLLKRDLSRNLRVKTLKSMISFTAVVFDVRDVITNFNLIKNALT